MFVLLFINRDNIDYILRTFRKKCDFYLHFSLFLSVIVRLGRSMSFSFLYRKLTRCTSSWLEQILETILNHYSSQQYTTAHNSQQHPTLLIPNCTQPYVHVYNHLHLTLHPNHTPHPLHSLHSAFFCIHLIFLPKCTFLNYKHNLLLFTNILFPTIVHYSYHINISINNLQPKKVHSSPNNPTCLILQYTPSHSVSHYHHIRSHFISCIR